MPDADPSPSIQCPRRSAFRPPFTPPPPAAPAPAAPAARRAAARGPPRATGSGRRWYSCRASARRPSCSKAAARSSRTRPTMPQRASNPAVRSVAGSKSWSDRAWPGSRRGGSRPGRPAGGGRWRTCILACDRVRLGQRAARRRPSPPAQRQQRPHFLRQRLARERAVLAQRAAVRGGPGEQPDRRRGSAGATWLPPLGRRPPRRLGGALPHPAERRGRDARSRRRARPAPSAPVLAAARRPRGRAADHLAPHLVGQVDGLGGARQVALVGEHVGGGGDVAEHRRGALDGPEVLRRHRVERGAQLRARRGPPRPRRSGSAPRRTAAPGAPARSAGSGPPRPAPRRSCPTAM